MKRAYKILVAIPILGCILFYVYSVSGAPPLTRVYFISLRADPAVFIRTNDDKRILIDGGGNSDIVREVSRRLPFYSRRIDTVIATTCDKNHVTGLIDILRRYDVGQVIVPDYNSGEFGQVRDGSCEEFSTIISGATKHRVQDIPTIRAKKGDTLELASELAFEAVFPDYDGKFGYSNSSKPDLVFTLSAGSKTMLFAGNATPKILRHIRKDLDKLELVYMSHGISGDNVPIEFMNKIRPQYVVYEANESGKEKNTKSEPDSLGMILKANRFNIAKTKRLTFELSANKIVPMR